MMKILMLAEAGTANTQNWVDSLTRFGKSTVEVWSFPKYPSWLRLLYIPIAVLKVRRKIRNFKPDVVIGYRTTSYGFIGALTNFHPLVLAAQGESDVWPPNHWSNHISSKMAKHAIRNASLIHAWGKNMVPALVSLGARTEQLLVLSRGIDMEKFTYKVPFSNDSQITLIVSRSLYPEYHHEILLKAYAKVVHKRPEVNFKLIVAGDGPLLLQLKEQCLNLEIGNHVLFAGRLDSTSLSAHLSEADIYISLPDTEGISSSLLEAMASGCYPIVTDLPANREFIESGKNGMLVSLEVDEVVNAILSVLDNKEKILLSSEGNRSLIEQHADTRINSAKFVARYKQLVAEV